MVERRRKSVLDGPGFGKGVGDLLGPNDWKRIEKLGEGAGRGVADYLDCHTQLAKRIVEGDIVDPVEVRRHSDEYRRLKRGREVVKHKGRPPRLVWKAQGSGLDEPWGGRDQEGTIIGP